MRRSHTREELDALVQKAVERWKSEPVGEKSTPTELGRRFGLSHVTVRRALVAAGLVSVRKRVLR